MTSQLFANIYLNEFDYFIKHELRVKHYVRYTDDFVIVADSIEYLESLLPPIKQYLDDALALSLHPSKVSIRKFKQGIDFLGYIIFPKHRLVRTKTRRRVMRKVQEKIAQYRAGNTSKESLEGTINSYLGVLSHANQYKLGKKIKDMVERNL